MTRVGRPGLRLVAAVLLLAALAGCATGPGAGSGGVRGDATRHLTVGGMDRSYRVHQPAGRSGAAGLPVVLVLHGRLGTADGMARLTHFDTVADRAGFLAVYPQGYRRSWHDARGTTPAAAAGVDDVAFLSAVIDDLVARDHADPARVYATGISNGGMLTQQLGCRLAGRLAGIAPVAGPMSTTLLPACHPARPLPVLEIHGTADPLVPYAGGPLGADADRGDVLSVPETVDTWRALDGCAAPPTVAPLPRPAGDGTTTTVSAGEHCRAGGAVVLYTVTGGGHTWPGGEQYLPAAVVGPTSRQFDASQVIWDFFAAHPVR
jgi:polyhydroxybutyrate depolymerase